MAYCPKIAVAGINSVTGDTDAVVMCEDKSPQQVSGAQSLGGTVFCVGCSRARHVIANCPYAIKVVDVSSGKEDLGAVAIGDDEGLQLSSLCHEEDQLDPVAVVGGMASCGDQRLDEDVSSESSQEQQEGVPDGRDSCLHMNSGGADQVDSQLSNAEAPVKEMGEVPKFQHRSAATVVVSPPRHGAAAKVDVISDDVMDLPQVEVGCPTPADCDVMAGAAAVPQDYDYMQAMIENMSRDILVQEESMTEWGIHEDMFDDCPSSDDEDYIGFF